MSVTAVINTTSLRASPDDTSTDSHPQRTPDLKLSPQLKEEAQLQLLLR